MSVNPSGWRPSVPERGGVAAATFTGNKALMLEEPLIFEIGDTQTTGVEVAAPAKVATRIGGLARSRPIGLPGLSEPETVRHYTRLSRQNYAIDLGLFPLGSCTMKHNPRLNEKVARMAGVRRLSSAGAGRHGAGRAGSDPPARALAGHADRHGFGRDVAQGRRPRRAVRDPRDPRGAGGEGRGAPQGRAGAGKRARHQSRDSGVCGLCGRGHSGDRRGPRRPGGAEGAAGAGRGGGDDHQSQHLRPVRTRHARDQRRGACGGRFGLLRRREFQRDRRTGAPRRPRHRRDAHQPPQDLFHAARAAAGRGRGRWCFQRR